MSDYDPKRLDPNRQDLNREDPNLQDPRDVPFDGGSGFSWNWVLGGLAAIVLLLVAMSFINDSQRSAEGIAPSAEKTTTGQSSPAPNMAPSMAPNAAPNNGEK